MRWLRTTDVVFFAVGVCVTVGLSLSFGSKALLPSAEAAGECLTPEAGAVSAKQVDSYTWTSRGTRSDVRVINGDGVDCQHISSVFAWNGVGGFEFGYVIGFSNCPGHTGQFFNNPKKMFWAFNSQGSFVGCRVWENDSLPEETFQNFRGSDINANGEWGSWYNGNELQPNGVLLDFSSAMNGWGMERGDRTDDGYARFNELSEYHDNGGWSRWDDQRLNADSDPDYDYDEINDYTGRSLS